MNEQHAIELLDYYEQQLCNIPYPNDSLTHLKTMFNPMRIMVYENQTERFNRWLGFVQGVLWNNDIFYLSQLRNHVRNYEDFIKEINREQV